MSHRSLASTGALAMIITLVSMATVPAAAQAPATAPKTTAAAKGTPLRTPWGEPDLQGIWTGSTITPLERPKDFAGREFLTEEEAAALENRALANRVDRPPAEGDPGTYNQVWFDPSSKVLPNRRTSLIVDPPDGRIPFTPDGQKAQARSRGRYGKGPYNSWLDLDTGERCVGDGPPIYFSGYNNNYQIVQSPGYVTIFHELYGEVRLIPTNGRPHGKIPQLLGDSVGRWEGDTLVVDTISFTEKKGWEWQDYWRSVRPTTHLVERFRRLDAETIDYQFTWEDPVVFTRAWTAAYPLTSNQASRGVTVGRLFEYACHEGNYGLANILAGAREQERALEEAAKKGSSR